MPPRRIKLFENVRSVNEAHPEALISTGIEWVPREDMKDLFRYCDLPTRCKLRQICQSWKRLVSLEDVNKVVVVDDSCLWICSTVPPKSDGGVKRPLQCNLIRPDAGNLIESRNVEDFRRDGLMGGHVRAIINQE